MSFLGKYLANGDVSYTALVRVRSHITNLQYHPGFTGRPLQLPFVIPAKAGIHVHNAERHGVMHSCNPTPQKRKRFSGDPGRRNDYMSFQGKY